MCRRNRCRWDSARYAPPQEKGERRQNVPYVQYRPVRVWTRNPVSTSLWSIAAHTSGSTFQKRQAWASVRHRPGVLRNSPRTSAASAAMSRGGIRADRERSLLRPTSNRANQNALTECRQSGGTEAAPQGYSSESSPTIEGTLRGGVLAAETLSAIVPVLAHERRQASKREANFWEPDPGRP